jgi:hypothetical protein
MLMEFVVVKVTSPGLVPEWQIVANRYENKNTA